MRVGEKGEGGERERRGGRPWLRLHATHRYSTVVTHKEINALTAYTVLKNLQNINLPNANVYLVNEISH